MFVSNVTDGVLERKYDRKIEFTRTKNSTQKERKRVVRSET
jgi:hypothetical protein